MRRFLSICLLMPGLVLLLAGCGRQDEVVVTPAACLLGPAVWTEALASLPETGEGQPGRETPPVLLDGRTPISDCLPAEQTAADQETVGMSVVEVATYLSAGRGSRGDGGSGGAGRQAEARAARAGYLVGALENGSRSSQGIHAALVGRVESAATNRLGDGGEALRVSYERGREAGLELG
ncbi:MAG: hypothetical protein ACK5NL_02880 [Vibrio fluvialis]